MKIDFSSLLIEELRILLKRGFITDKWLDIGSIKLNSENVKTVNTENQNQLQMCSLVVTVSAYSRHT